MIGIGAARLLPVVFALILGVLGMHALVTVDADHGMPTAVAAMEDSAAAGHQGSVSAVVPAMPTDHPGMHQVLHLCLAVLAGLVILLVGLTPILILPSADQAMSRLGRGRRAPPRRPPPTSLRLAQLCVMRN